MRDGFSNVFFTSRRTSFDQCRYWEVDENDYVDKNEIVHKREPSGYFDAFQVTSLENSSQIIGGTFMFDSNRVTIKTNDDVSEIKKNFFGRV